MFNRLKNIEDKNEEQLKLLCNTNETTSCIKNESDNNYDKNFAFYKLYRDFQIFKDRSLESKYNLYKQVLHIFLSILEIF